MADEQGMITARVGIFSGRENPVITLGGEAQGRFAERMQATIGQKPTHPPGPPKLGEFYGFIISIPRAIAEESALPTNVEVRGGIVSTRSSGEDQHWLDVAGLEDFLIGLSFEQGHGKLLERLGIKQDGKDETGATRP
jgi:hypothetical protein